MNKKIILSLSVIGLVAAIAIGGTVAYFSDTETSEGNTFSTGVIDINIDGENPWINSWDITDMKPCETGYITFNINNSGNNPVNVWKTITVTETIDDPINEPECVYGGGVWDSNSEACDIHNESPLWDYKAKSNLHDWMNYDLSVNVPIANNSDDWHQTIYKDEDGVKVSSIKDVFLGMIPAEGSMKVTQSYHLIPETQNWAQADTMKFDITIYGEQLKGELVLENKTGDPDWQIVADNYQATLVYNMTGPEFDYELNGKVNQNDTEYGLIYYPDPWPGTGLIEIGKGTSLPDGTIEFSGSINLDEDLPISADHNSPEGAKIWLVPTNNYDGTGMIVWNPGNYLFETGLTTYDDTDN